MIIIRETSGKEELEKHFEIRKKVFQEEQGVKSSDDLDLYDKKRECHSYIAFYQGKPVGAARWRENKAGYKLERICVLSEFRGLGIGKALVRYLINNVPQNLPRNLSAQFEMVPFYEKMGFVAKGESFWEAGLLHRFMKYMPEKDPESPVYRPLRKQKQD